MNNDVFRHIHDLFLQYSNEEKAHQMSKYMKGKFSFYGIQSPIRREISRDIITSLKPLPISEIIDLIKILWSAEHRELQYLAMDIIDKRKGSLNASHLELGEYLVLNKTWWDTVDYLSTHFFAPILISMQVTERHAYILKLVEHPSMWMNRVAIIFQLMRKSETETELLELSVIPHIASKEFFHQKAIGWALRQYSTTNPLWVRDFLDVHDLAPLSKREASKYL